MRERCSECGNLHDLCDCEHATRAEIDDLRQEVEEIAGALRLTSSANTKLLAERDTLKAEVARHRKALISARLSLSSVVRSWTTCHDAHDVELRRVVRIALETVTAAIVEPSGQTVAPTAEEPR